MARKGINKVIVLGNLGNDPECTFMPNGNAVAKISIATSESWKDKQSGQDQERTEWHRVTFFGKLAEIVGQYLRKGSKVYIEGSLRTNKWQDQNGNDRYTTEIMANEMQMLNSKSDNQQQSGQQQQQYQQQQPQPQQSQSQWSDSGPAQQQSQRQQTMEQSRQQSQPQDSDGFFDDIPFS